MKKLLLDMSSVMWMSLKAGKDNEHGRELAWPDEPDRKAVYVNSAGFGYENLIEHVVSVLRRFDMAPRDMVMVFEGKNSKSLRKSLAGYYKAGRDHHPAEYEEFQALAAKVRAVFLGLGALAVHQDGVEADDVLAYLAQNLRCPHVIDSNDGDLLVLMGEHTSVWTSGTGKLNYNKYGPWDPKYITLYKALVGDSSDKIKGASNFGETAFLELLQAFGEEGLDAMIEGIQKRELGRLSEDVGAFKKLQRIIDGEQQVYTSWDLARLYPEKIHTGRSPLQVEAGKLQDWNAAVHDARLKQWYGARRIISAENFEPALRFALEKILQGEGIYFDIETSTPPESDVWLEEKSKSTDGDSDKVDTFGSKLTSYSATFGNNAQYTWYFTVDHVPAPGCTNLTVDQARQFLELKPVGKPLVVHNAAFELPVCHMAWGEVWKDNGFHGFLPDIVDTQILKSYTNENTKLGLKSTSKELLGYTQLEYKELMARHCVRKMNELTAAQAFDYGCDDAICTAGIYNFCRFMMELERTWTVYEVVERKPAYLNAQRFLCGTPISLEKMKELEDDDAKAYDKAWVQLRDYLISKGWAGSVCPTFSTAADFTPAKIKEAFQICTGEELKTQVRAPEKLFALIVDKGAPMLGAALHACFDAGEPFSTLNQLLTINFRGEPQFNTNSYKQWQKLLYEVIGLPVRLRNKPTDDMRAAGIKEGQPSTDAATLDFALAFDSEMGEQVMDIVRAIQTLKMVETRRKLYYKPYRNFPHWKDGLIHSSVNQCATNTRRYSESDPNKQQLPKNAKYGHPARFREVYVPHHANAVVVSIDFSGQELRSIAEQSQDANMLECFTPLPGQKTKDMHALTGELVVHKRAPLALWRMTHKEDAAPYEFERTCARWVGCTYEHFVVVLDDPAHEDYKLFKELRNLGKKTNFTTEYGARAPKLARTLICTVEEAQVFYEARQAAFPRAEQWKQEVIAQAHKDGGVRTLMGAFRHLPDLYSNNGYNSSTAERQAVNTKVQGSCAEQTKMAEGRLWDLNVFNRYDANYIGPVHDELVSSVGIADLKPWLKEVHAATVAPYGGMRVPIVASISFGANYGQQIEVGDVFDEAEIDKGLAKLYKMTGEVAHA